MLASLQSHNTPRKIKPRLFDMCLHTLIILHFIEKNYHHKVVQLYWYNSSNSNFNAKNQPHFEMYCFQLSHLELDMDILQNITSGENVNYYLSSQFASHRHLVSISTIVILYSTVAVFGFMANAVVFGTLVAIGSLRHNATNIFVATLAFSDMVLCCFNVPIQVSSFAYCSTICIHLR